MDNHILPVCIKKITLFFNLPSLSIQSPLVLLFRFLLSWIVKATPLGQKIRQQNILYKPLTTPYSLCNIFFHFTVVYLRSSSKYSQQTHWRTNLLVHWLYQSMSSRTLVTLSMRVGVGSHRFVIWNCTCTVNSVLLRF